VNNLVVELVHGLNLEKRIKDLFFDQRKDITLRIVSLHVFNPIILDETFKDKLEKLIRHQAKITIVVDKKSVKKDPIKQQIVKELLDIGVRVHLRRNVHAKIISLESQSEFGMLVSSANISDHALHTYREAGIFILNEYKEQHDKLNSYISYILGNDEVDYVEDNTEE